MRLCWHRWSPWTIAGTTGEHDFYARTFGNTLLEKTCGKCGKQRHDARYDRYA